MLPNNRVYEKRSFDDRSGKMTKVFCFLFSLFTLLLGTANGQVNESELPAFFAQRQFKKFDLAYKKQLYLYFESMIAKTPKGSPFHQTCVSKQKLFKQGDLGCTAPPLLEMLRGDIGDLGRASHNTHAVRYVKVFQKLPNGKSLVKFSGDNVTYSDEVYLIEGSDAGIVRTDGGRQENLFLPPDWIFKRIADYQYRNALGALRIVRAYKVLTYSEWKSLVIKTK